MNPRNLLLAVTVVFAITETVDIVETGIAAAAFAVLFFACSAWLWRRSSVLATIVLSLLFLVEVTQAHTWKDTPTAVKIYAMVLGTVGLAAAAGVLVERFRQRRLARRPVAQSGYSSFR
jgi:peptidoglycan/LPS O-acetylase OafA/YrhL